MEKTDLEKLRGYAASSRSQTNFAGTTFIRLDQKAGQFTAGKAGTDKTGQKFVGDLPDVMGGYQRLEAGKKPFYALTRIVDAVDPVERSELGELDENLWVDNKDPWTAVTVLPLFDPETRQVFIYSATGGARNAVANLLEGFADHGAAYPEAADQLPIIELNVGSFIGNDGKTVYTAQLDIVGWTDRPAAVLHIKPPPLAIVEVAPKAVTAAPAETVTTESNTKPKAAAKPARKVRVPGVQSMDDEIPF